MRVNVKPSANYSAEPGEPESFQVILGGEIEPDEPRNEPIEMQIVPASKHKDKPFKLPSDWLVEARPRPNSSTFHSDKYYFEPGTGRKFRSLISVKRYLNGELDPPPVRKQSTFLPARTQSTCLVPYDNSRPSKRVVYGGKLYRPDELEDAQVGYTNLDDINPEILQSRSADTLPNGWIVEEVPRKCGLRSDRYYIDPTTGLKLRSIREVRRFLEDQMYRPKRKASTLNNRSTAPRSSLPRKKNNSNKTPPKDTLSDPMYPPKDTLSDPMYPPKKINWVYSGEGKDEGKDDWSPLLEECALPNYVTEQWSETFLLGMNGWNQNVPLLTMKESDQE